MGYDLFLGVSKSGNKAKSMFESIRQNTQVRYKTKHVRDDLAIYCQLWIDETKGVSIERFVPAPRKCRTSFPHQEVATLHCSPNFKETNYLHIKGLHATKINYYIYRTHAIRK